eukprot:TRINITY_DN22244_c0_g1_i1.p1 TRINITY_DN22244_c0_g1~~TRINITY_DN22244_c0_g1_i1.p1  ORF type:complete len:355 (+),score=131.61 TRINITY_DN22244_c0_g1_i1:96-1160(+)
MGGNGKKGKALKQSDLKKLMGVTKGAGAGQKAKDARKAAVRGAKRGRVSGDKEAARASDVVGEAKLIHPKSRKAQQVMRGMMVEQKKAGLQRIKDEREQAKAVRLVWFQERLQARADEAAARGARLTCLTEAELQGYVAEYVTRNDDELRLLREKRQGLKHRVTRVSGREKELTNTRDEEARHATSGLFEAPNLTTNKGIKALTAWDAEEDLFFNLVFTQVVCTPEMVAMKTVETQAQSYERLQELKAELKEYKTKRVSKRTGTTAAAEKADREKKQAARVKSKRAAQILHKRAAAAGESVDMDVEATTAEGDAEAIRAQKMSDRREIAAAATPFDFGTAGANPFGTGKANPFL